MTIIIPQEQAEIIQRQLIKCGLNETKGALFAYKIRDDYFQVDGVYIETKVGNIAFVELFNNKRYRDFQYRYHKKHTFDYVNHNYIGDWHSHPSFELFPSSFDQEEVKRDLKKSNARFLIQIIFKLEKDTLKGNAFFYDKYKSAEKINLIIK